MLLEKLQFPHSNQEQKLEKFFRTSKIITNKKTSPLKHKDAMHSCKLQYLCVPSFQSIQHTDFKHLAFGSQESVPTCGHKGMLR